MLTTAEHTLQRATPESQGVDSAAVLRFIEAVESQIHELHSFMLLRHGKVVAEGWWSPYRHNDPHMLFSLSKSFASTAVGLAVEEGCFSLDDPVLSFFPDDAPAEVSENLAAMRVRHLLSMSTGHAEDTTPHMVAREDFNWIKAFFNVPVLHAPGTHFLYNTGATYMLSAIVQKTTGVKLVDYLKPRLFDPLGIENAVWDESPQGINLGGWGLHITTEDIARFGQLYLQKGIWGDSRILPEAWVAEATAFHIANGDNAESDWAQGYGYQFWRCRHNAYRGDGAFGQYCVVMPDQDVVIAMTGGLDDMQQPLNLIWEILLPAMKDSALPEDPAARQRLTEKLSSLSLPPLRGQHTSPLAEQISGRIYSVEAHPLKVETLALTFDDAGCTATIRTVWGEDTIRCGYDAWLPGQTTLYNEPWQFDPAPIVASGAWTAEDTFTMIVRRHLTPFVHTIIWHFMGDRLIAEMSVNVSFGPLKAPPLEAHSAAR